MVGGVEVAYVALDWWPPETRHELVLYQVNVLSELQKQGIGTEILAAVEKLARDAGYPVIKLVARPLGDIPQEKLKSWYRKNGYIDADVESDEMRKQMKPDAGV
jgi:GNAT superfamily N-acetyltransferase